MLKHALRPSECCRAASIRKLGDEFKDIQDIQGRMNGARMDCSLNGLACNAGLDSRNEALDELTEGELECLHSALGYVCLAYVAQLQTERVESRWSQVLSFSQVPFGEVHEHPGVQEGEDVVLCHCML